MVVIVAQVQKRAGIKMISPGSGVPAPAHHLTQITDLLVCIKRSLQGSADTPHHIARYPSRPGVARAHPLRPGSLLHRRLHDFFDFSHAGPNVGRSLRGFRTCRWQLKHRRLLAFHQVRQEQDVAIRKLQAS